MTSAAEFARQLLLEIPLDSPTESTPFTPSVKQLNYADILGVEPSAWEMGITASAMRKLIDTSKSWAADFFTVHNAPQATGMF